MAETCETCRWQNKKRCHRNPPQVGTELVLYGLGWITQRFPKVESDDFCGEHQPREVPHA